VATGYGVWAAPPKHAELVANLTGLTVRSASWAGVQVGRASVDVWKGDLTNSNDGIFAEEGAEVIARGSYFASNFHSGVFALTGSDVAGDHNWFEGNLNLGAGCPGNSVFFPMTFSYWGHPSGPTVSSNEGGEGDRVSESVDYSDFLDVPPF
jgi:hypothetical protein